MLTSSPTYFILSSLSLSFFFPLASSEATSLLELTNSSSNRIIRFDRSFRSFPVQNVNLDVYKFNVTSSDVVRVEIVNQNLRPNQIDEISFKNQFDKLIFRFVIWIHSFHRFKNVSIIFNSIFNNLILIIDPKIFAKL